MSQGQRVEVSRNQRNQIAKRHKVSEKEVKELIPIVERGTEEEIKAVAGGAARRPLHERAVRRPRPPADGAKPKKEPTEVAKKKAEAEEKKKKAALTTFRYEFQAFIKKARAYARTNPEAAGTIVEDLSDVYRCM